MPEIPVSEKPSQVEVPPQNSFERMQRFLQQYGSKGRSEIGAGGIIGDFWVYLQPSFTKPPFAVPADLMVMQRDVSSAVPPDIAIELFEVKTKKEQDKEIKGERLVRITLRNPPGVRKERAFIYASPLLFPRTLVGLASSTFGLSLTLWKKSDNEYVTESEDEVSKIVNTIISRHTKTHSAEGLGVNRRSFLKRSAGVAAGAAAAAVALASIPDFPKQPSLAPEQDTLAQLKKEVEERFNIELLDEDQSYVISNRAPARWEVEQLEQFKRVFPLLPEHMYSIPPKTKFAIVLISPSESIAGRCCTVGGLDQKIVSIDVEKEVLNWGDKVALSIYAHELTHYLESQDRYLLPFGSSNRLKFYEAINEDIFEGKFIETAEELRIKVRKMRREYQSLSGILHQIQPHSVSQLQEEDLFVSLEYMLKPQEFAPVLAEHYVRGKERFFGIYTSLFGEEKAAQLYDFAKREIFKGKEY